MNIVYHYQGIEFEWDENKSKSNEKKHGITFKEAIEVFFDPFYQEGDASSNEEERNFIIGYSLSQRILLVIYVERSIRIRIISARQATHHERKFYEET